MESRLRSLLIYLVISIVLRMTISTSSDISWSKIRIIHGRYLSFNDMYREITAQNAFICYMKCMQDYTNNCVASYFKINSTVCSHFQLQPSFKIYDGDESDVIYINLPDSGVALLSAIRSSSVSEASNDCKSLGGHILTLDELPYYRANDHDNCLCGWVADGTQRRFCADEFTDTCSLASSRRTWCTVYP